MTKSFRRTLVVAAACAPVAFSAVPAGAAETTIGPDVNVAHNYEGACGVPMNRPCTVVNLATNPVRTLRAPCDGTVVRYRLNGIISANTYRIRAVTDNGNGTWTPTATSSPPVSIQSAGVNQYAASMPIKQGQYVGIDFMDSGAVGLRGVSVPGTPNVSEAVFYNFPADGTPDSPLTDTANYLYNADVSCGEPGTAAKKCKKKKKKKGKKGAGAAKKKKKKGCKKKKKGKK